MCEARVILSHNLSDAVEVAVEGKRHVEMTDLPPRLSTENNILVLNPSAAKTANACISKGDLC